MDEKEAENKRSLKNEKLKTNRTSETEEQRKERLRIIREKDRARRRLKGGLDHLFFYYEVFLFFASLCSFICL